MRGVHLVVAGCRKMTQQNCAKHKNQIYSMGVLGRSQIWRKSKWNFNLQVSTMFTNTESNSLQSNWSPGRSTRTILGHDPTHHIQQNVLKHWHCELEWIGPTRPGQLARQLSQQSKILASQHCKILAEQISLLPFTLWTAWELSAFTPGLFEPTCCLDRRRPSTGLA